MTTTDPCSCIYVGDGDWPEFHQAVKRKARVEHECDECGATIQAGETYECVTGKWDGPIRTIKTCSDCLSVRDAFFCEGWRYGTMWENVAQHILDTDGEISSECLMSLTPKARDRVCGMIDRQWETEDKP